MPNSSSFPPIRSEQGASGGRRFPSLAKAFGALSDHPANPHEPSRGTSQGASNIPRSRQQVMQSSYTRAELPVAASWERSAGAPSSSVSPALPVTMPLPCFKAPAFTPDWQPGDHTLATYPTLCGEERSGSFSPMVEIAGYPSLTQMLSARTTSEASPSGADTHIEAYVGRLVLWMLENLHMVTALTQEADVQPAELGCTCIDDTGWKWETAGDRFILRLLVEKADRLGLSQYRMMLDKTQPVTIFAPYPFTQTATPKIACYFSDTPVRQRCGLLQDLIERIGSCSTLRRGPAHAEKRRAMPLEQDVRAPAKRRLMLSDVLQGDEPGLQGQPAVQAMAAAPSVRSRMSLEVLLSAPEPSAMPQALVATAPRNEAEVREAPQPAAGMRPYRAILPAPAVSPLPHSAALSLMQRMSRARIRDSMLQWTAQRPCPPETDISSSDTQMPLGGNLADFRRAHQDYQTFTGTQCSPRAFYENLRDLCVVASRRPAQYASLVEVSYLGERLPAHYFIEFVPGRRIVVMAQICRTNPFAHAHLLYQPTSDEIRYLAKRVTRWINLYGGL